MAKALTANDYFTKVQIGKKFELDEVSPVEEYTKKVDENGEVALDKNGNAITERTGKQLGWHYSVTIQDGIFKKKSVQVKILDLECLISNEEILALDSVLVDFENLSATLVANKLYFKADKIIIISKK